MTKKSPSKNKTQEKQDQVIDTEGPISTEEELAKVEERLVISANIVYETIRREGDEELHRSSRGLAWSGLAAGLSMGFSFVAEALLMAHLPGQLWRPLISRFGYSLGFLIVVLGRQQLFTENTLTGVLPLLIRKDAETLAQVGKLWGIVLLTNLIGAYLFALSIAHVNMFKPDVRAALLAIGQTHMGLSFGVVLIRAIFAGWLIALMVWLLPGAESARVAIIVIITYIIGLGEFSHVIAGSTTVFYLVVMKAASWHQYFLGFFLPSLIGNVIGGVSLVAALGYAQVAGGRRS